MGNAWDDLRARIGGLVKAPAKAPLWTAIPPDRTDEPVDTAPLRPEVDYVRVRVHRVHLAIERVWLEQYAPLVMTAVDLSYDGQRITRPAVIGPAMFEQVGVQAPLRATVSGTVVAGPVPLQAGGISITVALHRVVHGNVANALFPVLDDATKALDFAAGLNPYLAVAKVVVGGIGALIGGERALMARRDELVTVTPGLFALIAPTTDVDVERLCVVKGELNEDRDGKLVPFSRADYVLYGVDRASPDDVDVTRLSLHQQWLAVLEEATKASTPEIWQSAKANLTALIGMAFRSPDLTYRHAEQLERQWVERVKARRARAQELGDLGGSTAQDVVRDRALAALRM